MGCTRQSEAAPDAGVPGARALGDASVPEGPPPPLDAARGDAPREPVPTEVAAIERGEEGSRLVVIDVQAQRVRRAGPWEPDLGSPGWSPDGAHLVYRRGSELLQALDGQPAHGLVKGIPMPADAPAYVFHPDSTEVTVVLQATVERIPLERPGAVGMRPGKVPLPSGCLPFDALWRPDGRTLDVLCNAASGSESPQVKHVRFDARVGKMVSRQVRGVHRLVGWDREHGLLAAGPVETGAGERIGALGDAGMLRPLRPPPDEAEAPGEYIQGYLPSRRWFASVQSGEDSSDPVVLSLSPLGSGAARRWLTGFPRLADLSLRAFGGWVAFIDHAPGFASGGEAGGDVYLVLAGSEDARLVLRSRPEAGVFYRSPTPRPSPAAR
ncbi:hypothetical protein [Myxococcus sp. SDU36]|uniref:hypothetical protein n=1 Tax=Myxococcus sp. SDU36 TaxID=2831967 RepID=UPI00254374AA|nr:hypothetical protein [Myxococcus sp. SDU36]WIG94822.1 hypothetical protein KGD87_30625 [Myxococcus sp. SDU36]